MAVTNIEVYAIQPQEATNLIINPSFETATTGYVGASSVIARDATQQRRGLYSCKVTPSSGVVASVYYSIALPASTQYTFSCDVLDVAGQTFNLVAYNSPFTQLATTSWTGTGHWVRKSVTFTTDANTPFTLWMTRSAVASVTPFYTDGWQLETGAGSSYLDGDMKGFVRGETSYYWNGTPHASTSFRSGQTRSGGTEVRLRDYMTIMTILGLGMSPVINNSLPNIRGGAFFQNSVLDGRTITLGGAITGTTTGAIIANRAALLNAVNPRQTQTEQPLILRIRGVDASGVQQTETVDAVVQYSGGMEGDHRAFAEKVSLQFQMFLPYLANEAETGTALTINQTVTNTNYIAYRDRSGNWSAMTTGTNGTIRAIVRGPDGSIYVGGQFTLAGGVANTVEIAKWDGATWTPLGTGMNGVVQTLVIGPDGTLYAGGTFTLAGGVANTVYVAKWNGSAWTPLSTGMNNFVYSLVIGRDGTLYAGGEFTLASGVANTSYVAKWNGSAWSALGTGGVGGVVTSLAVGLDGAIYATGSFTSMGGVANTNSVAKWNGTSWVSMGSSSAFTGYVVEVGLDGSVYVGGTFTSIAGVSANSIAKWNGTSWAPLGTGVTGAGATVWAIYPDPFGNLYVSGDYTSAGGVTPPDGIAMWNGSSFVYTDIDFPGTSYIKSRSILTLPNNSIYMGYQNSGSSITATVQSITNGNANPVYPKITFTGPGAVYQIKNYTTGKGIYFNYTLLAGESAVLDLNPNNIQFVSTFRGNVINTILPGSNLDWQLVTGLNSVSCFISGTTTAATACSLVWKQLYNTFDGAAY
jgi:hypothetical protein